MSSSNHTSGSGLSKNTPENASNTAFLQIIKWAGAMMVVAVSLGFLYRIIMPVERHLEEQEYQMKVFTEFDVDVYKSPSTGAPVFGTFEGGSVLYVMAEASLEEGDSLIFEGMGAYSTATVTRFNGYGAIRVITVQSAGG